MKKLFTKLLAIVSLIVIGTNVAMATSYIPTLTKTISEDLIVHYSDFSAAISQNWAVYANGSLTNNSKTPKDVDGTTLSGNTSCLQVKADGGVFNSNKRVLHFRVTGISGVIASGSAGTGCGFQIGATEMTNTTTESSPMTVVAGSTSAENPVSCDGLDPDKTYVVSIFAYGGDTHLYGVKFIAGTQTINPSHVPSAITLGAGTESMEMFSGSTGDSNDKDKLHEYTSTSIAATYIAGIDNTDSKKGLKFRVNKSSQTKIGSSALDNAIEISVNSGATISKIDWTDFRSNRAGIVTVSEMYVDGVKDDSFESFEIPADSEDRVASHPINVNASQSIIFVLTPGNYDKEGTPTAVDQIRCTFKATYVRTASLNLNASGYATFCHDQNVDIEGANAYKASVDNTTISLTKINGAIPANTGVILYGAPSAKVTIKVATSALGDVTGNDLKASCVDDMPVSGFTYALSGNQFMKYTGVALAPNKAFLAFDEDPMVASSKGMRIVFGGTATGVSTIETAKNVANGAAYNLAGQRVNANAKGIVVVNGKKFLNK